MGSRGCSRGSRGVNVGSRGYVMDIHNSKHEGAGKG